MAFNVINAWTMRRAEFEPAQSEEHKLALRRKRDQFHQS
ncbi:hypothetical protein STRDD13_00222 [Streptococcus sp. DD13]|nr:hypothetical protein STRDD13_00222 [Streptococcus sp. DD13]